MKLAQIVHTSQGVTQERSRLKKIAFLAECLWKLEREEIETGISFLSGDLRQGAQEGVLIEAIARAAGVVSTTVRRAWMLTGDAGNNL